MSVISKDPGTITVVVRVDDEALSKAYSADKGARITDWFGPVELSPGSHDVGIHLYLDGQEVRWYGSVVKVMSGREHVRDHDEYEHHREEHDHGGTTRINPRRSDFPPSGSRSRGPRDHPNSR
ncbi:Uncharacterized protein MK1175 [Methanopyrus kandleri AV19]|uniref:Uncharacterized protein n=2 Tax=Methanopyrus kandleri TaxID=2320 RepID=Q8TW61_METKA|nr:Uncharacterized protein MK1175 [Methanopyrus kandleri AV19]